MWCLFNGTVLRVCFVLVAALKVGRVVKKKSLEDGVKDARMSGFYR